MLANYYADRQTFKFRPRPAQEFQFQFLCFEHSDSVWLRVPRPWPGMPRSANLAGVTNCCWIHPTLYLKWEAPSWVKRHEPNRLVRPQKLVEASSNSTTINLLKLPKMWRLLMRVEKRLMVLSGARAHTKKHSTLEDLSLSCLQSVFLRLSNARCFMIHSIRWRSKGWAPRLMHSLRSSRIFKARVPC